MVVRPQGQALCLPAAYRHLPSIVMAEKLSPRLAFEQGSDLKLLVSYGGHFVQVCSTMLMHPSSVPSALLRETLDTRGVAKRLCGGREEADGAVTACCRTLMENGCTRVVPGISIACV